MSEQRARRQTTYSNADINSYDSQFSNMSYTWADGRGLIAFAPIFQEFVGKQPKRGDSVYDYESKLNFSLDAQGATLLLEAINTLMSVEDVKSVVVPFGSKDNKRTISIFKPNTLRLGGKSYPNFIVRVSVVRGEEEEKMYHLMQTGGIEYKTVDGDNLEEEIEVDMLVLKRFCEQVLTNSFGVAYHAAKRQGAFSSSRSSGGEGRSQRRRSNVEEEEDDEGESQQRSSSGGRSRRSDDDEGSSGGGRRRQAEASLEDEFNE